MILDAINSITDKLTEQYEETMPDIETTAENLAKQLVNAANAGTTIDWSNIDAFSINMVIKSFSKPLCK